MKTDREIQVGEGDLLYSFGYGPGLHRKRTYFYLVLEKRQMGAFCLASFGELHKDILYASANELSVFSLASKADHGE